MKRLLSCVRAVLVAVTAFAWLAYSPSAAQTSFSPAVVERASQREDVLHFFAGPPDGTLPNVGHLVSDRAGDLFGATNTGGSGSCKFREIRTGCGVIFELVRSLAGTYGERVLYDFKDIPDGAGPYGTLTLDGAGNIFGVTLAGGNTGCVPLFWVYRGCGTAFELTRVGDSWKKRTLHVFTGGSDGGNPVVSLVMDTTGNLYGTTYCGGPISCYPDGSGAGVFFKLSRVNGAWTEIVLHNFGVERGDGAFPLGDLTPNGPNKIFGTTAGSVYELTRPSKSGAWSEMTLFLFSTDFKEGFYPKGGIAFDASGDLFGMTYAGGDFNCQVQGCGVVFELIKSNDGMWMETILHEFTGGSDGAYPLDGLAMDAAGNLYGTTTNGGDTTCNNGGGCGVVFTLTPAGANSHETVLHTF